MEFQNNDPRSLLERVADGEGLAFSDGTVELGGRLFTRDSDGNYFEIPDQTIEFNDK